MLSNSPLAQAVEQAVEGLLSHVGYELVLVEFLPKSRILRLTIDFAQEPVAAAELALAGAPKAADGAPGAPTVAADGQDRLVTLSDCSKVSRLVSDVLDAEGTMSKGQGAESGEGYRLEVSSPGMDRPLVKPAHFRRFVGQPVRLSTRGRLAGFAERRFEAKLSAADEAGIAVQLGSDERRISYADLDRAQLVPTFNHTAKEMSHGR